MIFNKDKRRKRAVIEYFKFIEEEVLPKNTDPEVISIIADRLTDGYLLIENNEWGIAFENLSTELVENYVILDRKGIEKDENGEFSKIEEKRIEPGL
ncbi:MAG: hypothetical protein R2824_31435 [Saprospiraceae bacterium]|nr:hypothetical protein [Lewinella sp.]